MSAYQFHSSPERSRIMSAIRSKDTKPELLVRFILRQIGYPGYRLHRRDLPGKPDVAYVGRKKAIFVHGCFWHGHDCVAGIRRPKVNESYWRDKIDKNRNRDEKSCVALSYLGWSVLVVWECELRDINIISEKLSTFLRYDHT